MKLTLWHPKHWLIILALLALACGCGGGEALELPFRDNFSDSNSGWGSEQREEFERGYEAGEYFIQLHEPNWFTWTHLDKQIDDVSVEVDGHLASGSHGSHFGMICRQVDRENFYYFAISADGFYAIFRRADGEMEILSGNENEMSPSSAIRTGQKNNHILATCQGNELSLYVNGQLVETVTDDTHAEGDVGIGAGSDAKGGARVQFDNFAATKP